MLYMLSAAFLARYKPSVPRAVLSAVVCDGKKGLVVEVWVLL